MPEPFATTHKLIKLMMRKKYQTAMTLFFSLVSTSAIAKNPDISSSALTWLSYPGRISATATETKAMGALSADGMQAIYGNNSQLIFADVMTDYASNDTYLLSPGAGYRQVIDHNQIIGINFFSDYERTNLGENFWVLSPGIEWMNTHWDAHLNAYFPTNTQQQSGNQEHLSDYGDYSHYHLIQNTNDDEDEFVQPCAVIGDGVDTEIAYSFANENNLRMRIYGGIYYYQPPNTADVTNITGLTAGVEKPLNKNAQISLMNSYDNLNHYIFGISLTVTFGQASTEFSTNVQDRLLDPIERHVGIIDTGAGTYDQESLQYEGMDIAWHNNIVSMSPNGEGSQDGTAGNAEQLTQDNLDKTYAEFPNGARIYLLGDSTFSVDSMTATKSDGDYLGLYVYDGQDFYGRTPSGDAPATRNDRPTITVDAASGYNGFIMQNGENTFSDIIITQDSTSMQTNTNPNDTPAAISGIVAVNNSSDDFNLTVINSSITGMDNYGIYAANKSNGNLTITTNNSAFNDNGALNAESGSIKGAAGIYARNESKGKLSITTQDSQFNGNGIASADNSSVTSYIAGIFMRNTGSGDVSITLNNSKFNGNGIAKGTNSSISDYASGVYVRNNSNGTLTLAANHSYFNDNGFGATNGSGTNSGRDGMNAENNSDTGTVKVSALFSTFNNNGRTGLYVSNLSTSSHGTLAVTSLFGSSFNNNNEYGIYGFATIADVTSINTIGTTILHNGDAATGDNIDDNIRWFITD